MIVSWSGAMSGWTTETVPSRARRSPQASKGWLAASRIVAPRTVSSSLSARTIERGTLRNARRRSTSAGAVYSGFQAVTTRVSTWPASISWASRARRPDPGSESTSGLGRKTTVLPTFPSASLTAAARAWTAGGWRSPATTTDRPRDPARSLATAAAAFARSPSAGAPSGASCGSPWRAASSAATARANPATSAPRIRKRWSAMPPVIVYDGSATYSRFIPLPSPASRGGGDPGTSRGGSRRAANSAAWRRGSPSCARRSASRERMTSASARRSVGSSGRPKASAAPARAASSAVADQVSNRAFGNRARMRRRSSPSVGEVVGSTRKRSRAPPSATCSRAIVASSARSPAVPKVLPFPVKPERRAGS